MLAILGSAGLLGHRALRVLWSVGSYAGYWKQRADEPGELLYIALGDSTAQGIGASAPELGYVGLLAEDLERRTGSSVRVVNLSVSGARAADVLHEQMPGLRRLVDEGHAPDLVTVTVGSNDAGRTTPEEFRQQLGAILDALPAGTRVADVPHFQRGARLDAAADLARIVREEMSRRPGLSAVDLYGATTAMSWSDYSGDFFHPGNAGYRRYHRAFADGMGVGKGRP